MSDTCDRCEVCSKELNTTFVDSAMVGCRLCGKSAYCGEQCAKDDWTNHSVECNVHAVPELKTLIAMPYAFHDVIDDKHFAEEDYLNVKQSHLVSHVNSVGLVSTRVHEFQAPNLVNQSKIPARFTIRVNNVAVTSVGNSKTDLIESRAPGIAGKLATQRLPTTGKNLWLPVSAPVTLAEGEPFTVSIYDEAEKKTFISAQIQRPIHQVGANVLEELSRRAKAPVLAQFKDKRINGSVKELVPLVAQDDKSTIRMVFNHDALVDVEYELSGAPASEWTATPFKCDARDIDQVAGLVMAISEQLDDSNEQLTSDYKLIHAHLEKLNADPNTQPTSYVNAAIHRVMQQQLETVGGLFSYPKEAVRILRTKTTEELMDLMEDYLDKAENPTNKRWHRLNLQLAKNAESRIDTVQNSEPRESWKPGTPNYVRLSALRVRLENARQAAPGKTKDIAAERIRGVKKGLSKKFARVPAADGTPPAEARITLSNAY